MATMQCTGCGKRIIQKGDKCPHCDTPLDAPRTPSEKYNKELKNKAKLTTCPACNEPISKNATSCPHCGEPLISDNAFLGVSNIGYIGSILMFIGAFLPAINIPIRGSISYIGNGKGDGILIIFIAILSFYYIYKQSKKSLFLSGIFSLGIILYGFITVVTRINKVSSEATGIGKAILGGVSVGYGFGVMAVGVILIIISSLMMKTIKDK